MAGDDSWRAARAKGAYRVSVKYKLHTDQELFFDKAYEYIKQ